MASALTLEQGGAWFAKIPIGDFTLKDGERALYDQLFTNIAVKVRAMIKANHPNYVGKITFDSVVRGNVDKMSGRSRVIAFNGKKGTRLKDFTVLDKTSVTALLSLWFTLDTANPAAAVEIQMSLPQVKTYKIIKDDPGRFNREGTVKYFVYSDSEDDMDELDADDRTNVPIATAAATEAPAATEEEPAEEQEATAPTAAAAATLAADVERAADAAAAAATEAQRVAEEKATATAAAAAKVQQLADKQVAAAAAGLADVLLTTGKITPALATPVKQTSGKLKRGGVPLSKDTKKARGKAAARGKAKAAAAF